MFGVDASFHHQCGNFACLHFASFCHQCGNSMLVEFNVAVYRSRSILILNLMYKHNLVLLDSYLVCASTRFGVPFRSC